MNFKINIYQSFNESLKIIWEDFEKESINYCFQNYYWLEHWYSNTSKKKKIEIYILLIHQNDKLIMILPFCIQKKNGLKLLRWLGEEQADYMNGLFLKNNSIDERNFLELWKLIKKQIPSFDLVYFEKQPEYLENMHNPFVRYLNAKKNYISNSIMLDNSLDIFLKKNLKKKFVDDTKRRSKHLSNKGKVEFKIYENDNNLEKKKITEEMIKQKILRINDLKLKNILNRNAQDFYLNFDNSQFTHGQLHISSLNLDGKILSIHWGVVYKNIFYHLMPTISKTEFMKFAPGRLLLFHLVQWSIDNKINKFDFTIGDESYKKDWANVNNYLFNYFESNSYKSYPIYLYLFIKFKLKNFLKKYLFIKKIHKLLIGIIR